MDALNKGTEVLVDMFQPNIDVATMFNSIIRMQNLDLDFILFLHTYINVYTMFEVT